MSKRDVRYALALLLLGFWLTPSQLAFACDPPPTKLHIFFTNGILATRKEAERAKDKLCDALRAEQFKIEVICDLTYNHTDGPFEDLIESADQVLTQFNSQLLLWLHGVGLAPDWFVAWQQKMLLAEYQINAPELATHVADYRSALHQAEKVLIVAHSQGNLYAQQAYQLIAKEEPASFEDSVAVSAVATPANATIRYGDYLTNHRDVIQLVPGALPYNWDLVRLSTGKAADDVGMIAAHNFLNTYLSTEFSLREYLIQDVKFANGVHLERPAPELITVCAKSIASISLQEPKYSTSDLRFTAVIENPERDYLKIYCSDDIDGVVSTAKGGQDCVIPDDWVAYDQLKSFAVHGRASFLGVPRGTGTITVFVQDPEGSTVSQTLSVAWDCCDGPNVPSFLHYHTKYSCDNAFEHDNHCGTWWQ